MAFVFCILIRNVDAQYLECIDRKYGAPGCPLEATEERPFIQSNCGDGIIDGSEECDLGRFNGMTNCSEDCTLLFCGDGVITPMIGEECEPTTEKYYVLDPQTNQVVVETRFATALCGIICDPPTCFEDGTCSGGCKQRMLNTCTGDETAVLAEVIVHAKEEPVEEVAVVEPEPEPEVVHTAAPVEVAQAEPFCGNGTKEKGEECDDGNFNNYDECPNTCISPVCGNGIREGTEACDDGNEVDEDKCSNECTRNICGDGILQPGEDCDDGDANANEPGKCRTTCEFPACGDEIIDVEEECDNGEANSNTGPGACRLTCLLAVCGDTIVDTEEECDDGNDVDDDECTNVCMEAACGDGILHEGEECDDGNDDGEDECTNSCRPPRCGDGYVYGNEECDEGDLTNSDTAQNKCRTSCRLPTCGDGVVDEGEECDGPEDCSQECKILTLREALISTNSFIAAGVFSIGIFTIILYLIKRSKRNKLNVL